MSDKNPTPPSKADSADPVGDIDQKELTAKDAEQVKGGATSSIVKKLDQTQAAIINKI